MEDVTTGHRKVMGRSLRVSSFVGASLQGMALVAALACGPPHEVCHESCEGNVRRACTWDYGPSQDNGTEICSPRSVCIEAGRSYGYYAACALGGAPDRRCSAEGELSFCDGERLARCHGAYRVAEEDCAARGLVCETVVVNGFADHRCVTSHEKEPRCQVDLTQATTFCDGDELVLCVGGFVTGRGFCSGGTPHCVEVDNPRCAETGSRCLETRCVP